MLGLSIKNAFAPVGLELARLDEYVHQTLLGLKKGRQYATPHFSLQDPASLRIRMTTYYYHYTPDYHTALQFDYPGQPSYYTELDKCTIGPSWCAFNSFTNQTRPGWHPADYRQYNFPHQTAVYYSLYLAARNLDRLSPPLSKSWQWYMDMAARTLLSLGCCAGPDGAPADAWQCRCVPAVGSHIGSTPYGKVPTLVSTRVYTTVAGACPRLV